MDLLYLLEQLEEVLGAGMHPPLMRSRTLVDEQEILDILDQIRVAVPEEIKTARRINKEHDEIVASAQTEAERIIRQAEEQIAGRVTEHALVREARARADAIESTAKQEADEIRREVDDYAYRLFERLRDQVGKVNQAVNQGLSRLAETQDIEPDQEPPEERNGREGSGWRRGRAKD